MPGVYILKIILGVLLPQKMSINNQGGVIFVQIDHGSWCWTVDALLLVDLTYRLTFLSLSTFLSVK